MYQVSFGFEVGDNGRPAVVNVSIRRLLVWWNPITWFCFKNYHYAASKISRNPSFMLTTNDLQKAIDRAPNCKSWPERPELVPLLPPRGKPAGVVVAVGGERGIGSTTTATAIGWLLRRVLGLQVEFVSRGDSSSSAERTNQRVDSTEGLQEMLSHFTNDQTIYISDE